MNSLNLSSLHRSSMRLCMRQIQQPSVLPGLLMRSPLGFCDRRLPHWSMMSWTGQMETSAEVSACILMIFWLTQSGGPPGQGWPWATRRPKKDSASPQFSFHHRRQGLQSWHDEAATLRYGYSQVLPSHHRWILRPHMPSSTSTGPTSGGTLPRSSPQMSMFDAVWMARRLRRPCSRRPPLGTYWPPPPLTGISHMRKKPSTWSMR
mmetsp:Transcript_18992/g.52285  ORF Transcript_18992/g.52285 Transcript_18992/m.52285 type:complete len:206 (-) Transcript_18992:1665-2282(-)